MSTTFEDIEKDPKYKLLIEHVKKKHGSPIPENIKNLIIEGGTRSVERVNQTVRWTDLLLKTTRSIIVNESSLYIYPLFWVYLYGTLTEMISDFDIYKKYGAIPKLLTNIYSTLLKISSAFDEDELRFIKFMRHSHVHLHLDYYWSKTKTENGEIVKIKIPTELDARNNAIKIITKYGGEQNAAAYNFAKRIINDVESLYKYAKIAISTV